MAKARSGPSGSGPAEEPGRKCRGAQAAKGKGPQNQRKNIVDNIKIAIAECVINTIY